MIRPFALLMLTLAPAPATQKSSPEITAIEVKSWSYWSSRLGHPYAWRFRIIKGGLATYTGRFGDRKGVYVTKFRPEHFRRLAAYARKIEFSELQGLYRRQATDSATIETTVEYGDEHHIVVNYADAGPEELWILQMTARALADWVRTPVQGTPNFENDRGLHAPSIASETKAVEILRVWAKPTQECGMTFDVNWEDPRPWGGVLVDVIRHVSHRYSRSGQDAFQVADEIRESFEQAWSSTIEAQRSPPGEDQDR